MSATAEFDMKTAAASFIDEVAEDCTIDDSEPYELCELRAELIKDRDRLADALVAESAEAGTGGWGYLSFDDLYWMARFSFAHVEDYVDEANVRVRLIEDGFPDVPYCFNEHGVPCRPRHAFNRTLRAHAVWSGSDEYPITAWDKEDHAASCGEHEAVEAFAAWADVSSE